MKSALPIAFASADTKLGYHWQREGASLLVPKALPDPTSVHVVDQYVDVVRAYGAKANRATFDLAPQESEISYVEELLRREGISRPFVLMNAGAGWGTKRWAPENFAKLADSLTSQGASVAFLGTEMDRPAFAEVQEAANSQPVDLLGKTNVRQLIALIAACDLHIAGDTGSTHIAAALGKPCIGLYTLTKPERCCPYGQYENALSLDLAEVTARARALLS